MESCERSIKTLGARHSSGAADEREDAPLEWRAPAKKVPKAMPMRNMATGRESSRSPRVRQRLNGGLAIISQKIATTDAKAGKPLQNQARNRR